MRMKIIDRNFPTTPDPMAREGAGLVNRPPAGQAGPWLYGTVRSVEPSREMLFLHLPEESSEQIIHWLPQTRFLYHGAEVKPDALHDGQQISVQYSSDAGQKFEREINIVVEPPAIESTAAAQRRSLWPFRTGKKARK